VRTGEVLDFLSGSLIPDRKSSGLTLVLRNKSQKKSGSQLLIHSSILDIKDIHHGDLTYAP